MFYISVTKNKLQLRNFSFLANKGFYTKAPDMG